MRGSFSQISRVGSTLRSVAMTAGLMVGMVGAAEATSFGPGFDLFSTVDFPVTFVDMGGPIGVVPLEGNPITGLGNTDTIVERLTGSPAVFNPGDSTFIDIELVALSLQSIDPVDVGGMLFDVQIFSGDLMGEAANPVGQMEVFHTEPNGGFFNLVSLQISFHAFFTEVGNPGNMFDAFGNVEFKDVQAPWCHDPAPMDAHTLAFPANGFHAGVQCPGTAPPVKSEPIGHITSDEEHYTQAAMVSEPAPLVLLGVGFAVGALRMRRRAA